MLKPDQIPDEVWLAMRDYVMERPYGYDFTEAIAAAINAWPGIVTKGEVEVNANGGLNGYYLPLSTDNPDAEA